MHWETQHWPGIDGTKTECSKDDGICQCEEVEEVKLAQNQHVGLDLEVSASSEA